VSTCEDSSTDTPSADAAASTVAMKSCLATGSSIATGSSSTSSRGRRASARVSASWACWPPDSLPAFRLGEMGLLFVAHSGQAGVAISFLQLLAFWLAGVVVRTRGQAASLAVRSAEAQRRAEQAAAAERARIAWELHDIVAHHLSVIVLQAGGARASGKPAGPALEKIENSGRQALAETRRLLGVLRDPGEETGLAPQPGIGDLDALAASVRAAGLPVKLAVSGDLAALPAAADVSVYRIVQEALTNVLKHAGPARADVTIGCAEDVVTIEVTDDGAGQPGPPSPTGGHGLAGMRERTAVFGGALVAGPRAGGGFAVRARLPLGGGPPGEPS